MKSIEDALSGHKVRLFPDRPINNTLNLKLVLATLIVVGAFLSSNVSATGDCVNEDGVTISDWQNWLKLTNKPIISEGHENSWVNIYVNELAEGPYRNSLPHFPVCAKIVKISYKDEEGKVFDGITAMAKMPSGYDSTNGDWWYAIYNDMGSKPKKQGKLVVDCVSCHKRALETDYLFSNEVMISIAKD